MKKALWLLRENIQALLSAQHSDQKDLADWVGKDKSWINKILNGSREMQFEDLDRVAEFLHVQTYQLFIPGIAGVTERRSGSDRRSGFERRTPENVKSMIKLRSHIQSVQKGIQHAPQSAGYDDPREQRLTALKAQIQRLTKEATTLSSEIEARQQAPVPRGPVSDVSKPRRRRRRPNAEHAGE